MKKPFELKKQIVVALIAAIAGSPVAPSLASAQPVAERGAVELGAMAKRVSLLRLRKSVDEKRADLAKAILEKGLIEHFQNDTLTAKFYGQSRDQVSYRIAGAGGALTAAGVIGLVFDAHKNSASLPPLTTRLGTISFAAIAAGIVVLFSYPLWQLSHFGEEQRRIIERLRTMSADEIVERYKLLAASERQLIFEISQLESQIASLE